MNIVEVPNNSINLLKKEISLLLVTATNTETIELLNNISPLPNSQAVIKIFNGPQTFYIGIFGIYGVVLVQSNMGSIGRESSMMTTFSAIEVWDPKAVIMIGIAFGVNSKKQKIGDVLISSHIIPYEFQKVGTTTAFRSELPPASDILINRVKEIRDWEFKLNEKVNAKVYLGPMLTGEKVIDNDDFIQTLIKAFPNAIGGEMESGGIYAAASRFRKDWIIIKSICDFADGKKGVGKKLKQELAIKSAVNFSKKLLSSKYAFAELNFKAFETKDNQISDSTGKESIENLLAFLDSNIQDTQTINDVNLSESIRITARQITQNKIDKKLQVESTKLKMLIPKNILDTFNIRVNNCWDMYNSVLSSADGYLDPEIDKATKALINCICRELNRIYLLNGSIPPGRLRRYFEIYKCNPI